VTPANSDTAAVDSWGDAAALSLEGERAQITLDSIGDAVVSTDLAGRITYLNPVAERMTGWSRQEAAGRPLEEVLRIVEGASRESALNPLTMAILHKTTVGLGANSVLIDRHGREFAIEDNAAPIRAAGDWPAQSWFFTM
jgi:PAS domain S-box-containing protein